MSAPTSAWALTKVAHPAYSGAPDVCEECLALAEDAAVMARVTGSVGATSESQKDGITHSATVARMTAMVTLSEQGNRTERVGAAA